ncbi:MAG: HTH domain-containing protein [Actinobacteria bacterium]|nr:MAG: HTH domain-containing protein [Actinomycetota bacterium]
MGGKLRSPGAAVARDAGGVDGGGAEDVTHTPADRAKVQERNGQVLDALKKAKEPLTAAQVSEATGLDRKAVDNAMDDLKKSGAIVSPKRCCWEPA